MRHGKCFINFTFQTIRCQSEDQDMQQTSFFLEISCTPDDLDAIEFCAMPLVELRAKDGNSTIDFNYVTDDDEICPRILQHVKLAKFVANQFIIFYGCTAYEADCEEGAWILGYKSNITESLSHLNEALSFLKNSSAKVEDFRIYNNSAAENLTGIEVRKFGFTAFDLVTVLAQAWAGF